MTKTQIISIAKIINKTNSNDSTRKTFTVKNGDAYFTPDGYIGYKIPMDILYEAEEKCEIKIPEASESNVISNTFNEMCYKDYLNTYLNAKEFLAELKKHYKELSDNIGKLNADKGVYIINIRGTNHIYNLKRLINVLELFGNNTKMYVSDNARSVMMFISDVGGMVLMPAICKDRVMKVNLTLD